MPLPGGVVQQAAGVRDMHAVGEREGKQESSGRDWRVGGELPLLAGICPHDGLADLEVQYLKGGSGYDFAVQNEGAGVDTFGEGKDRTNLVRDDFRRKDWVAGSSWGASF